MTDACCGSDTPSVARDGYLYFAAAQFHRRAAFHAVKDLRQKPYMLFQAQPQFRRVHSMVDPQPRLPHAHDPQWLVQIHHR